MFFRKFWFLGPISSGGQMPVLPPRRTSLVFKSHGSQRVRSWREMKYTSQHCCGKRNGRQNGLI